MQTVLDKSTRDELITRIQTLSKENSAKWGKMNVYQMLRHCTLWEEWVRGSMKLKQVLVGRLFGKRALKNLLKDGIQIGRSTATLSVFRNLPVSGDVEMEKARWIAFLQEYDHFAPTDFVHPFFGKMSREEICGLAYKHADHHLRQFGA